MLEVSSFLTCCLQVQFRLKIQIDSLGIGLRLLSGIELKLDWSFAVGKLHSLKGQSDMVFMTLAWDSCELPTQTGSVLSHDVQGLGLRVWVLGCSLGHSILSGLLQDGEENPASR